VLKVTDETFKQNTYSLQLNVDNTLPTGLFNYNDDLPFFGPPANKTYSFFGNAGLGGDYLLIGSAEDTGTISGVESIQVYFVKGGNFYNPKTGATTGTSTASVPDMTGTPQVIPFTQDPALLIDIDNRSERGIYDTDPVDGDNDGFEESLRSKGTFDEWFVYFDAAVLPDGPMDMYTVVYDTAGNYAFEQVNIQIANDPPVIDSVEIDGSATLYSGLFRETDTLYLKVNATATAGIVDTTYKATLSKKVVAPNGAVTALGPALGTEYNIADTSGDAANEITIDIRETPTTAFVSDVQYTFTIEVADLNGNITSTDVDVWVDNLDDVDPVVVIDTFNQSNVADTNGHVESATESPDATDADLSGTVRITGTAWDDNAVSSIEVSFDGGTVWNAVPGGNITLDSSDVELGKDYGWYYEWDTSTLPNVTAADLTIDARVSDTANPTPNTGTDSLQVDVVPYITGIERLASLYNTNRTKYGKYLVQQNETQITVTGYNLRDGGAGDWVRIYNDAGGAFEAVTVTDATAAPNSLEISMAGITASGHLRISVANQEAGNYANDDSLDQNKEDDGFGLASTLWNDDRYLFVWDVSEAFGNSSNAEFPAMEMNDTNGDLYASWAHYYSTAMRAGLPMTNPAAAVENTDWFEVQTSTDLLEYNDIAVDTAGNWYVAYLDNLYYNLFGVNWGWFWVETSGGQRAQLEHLGDDNIDSPNPADGRDEYLYQFQNPKIINLDGYSYVVYYDSWAQALKYGVVTGNTETFVADQNPTNGANVVAGIDDFDSNPSDSGDDVGLYSAIGLDPDDSRIVTVFYNSTEKRLQLARGAQTHGVGAPAINNTNNGDWTIQDVTVLNGYIGSYVNMAIDPTTGDLHIVAYRVSNGDLVYIHAADVDGAATNYVFDAPVVIDSVGNVGKHVDITLLGSTPYISYLGGDVGTFDGVKFAYYTGAGAPGDWDDAADWEYGIVPSDSVVEDRRTSVEASTVASWGKLAVAYDSDYYSLAYLLDEQP
jgi:hypothetical protein